MRGFIFYNGPSLLDRKPIIGVATLETKNAKTGNLIQTWILRSDTPPIEAIHRGDDESICGDCPLRGLMKAGRNVGRGCYVAVHQAPYQIYNGYKRGVYSVWDKSMKSYLSDRKVRLGSYGDPTAIPKSAWKVILNNVVGWTGYTHQWKQKRFRHWQNYIMASTHSLDENRLAHSMGWRTFRTLVSQDEQSVGEITCPASAEGGFRRTCETCMACGGGPIEKRSITIVAHGRPSVVSQTTKTIVQISGN